MFIQKVLISGVVLAGVASCAPKGQSLTALQSVREAAACFHWPEAAVRQLSAQATSTPATLPKVFKRATWVYIKRGGGCTWQEPVDVTAETLKQFPEWMIATNGSKLYILLLGRPSRGGRPFLSITENTPIAF